MNDRARLEALRELDRAADPRARLNALRALDSLTPEAPDDPAALMAQPAAGAAAQPEAALAETDARPKPLANMGRAAARGVVGTLAFPAEVGTLLLPGAATPAISPTDTLSGVAEKLGVSLKPEYGSFAEATIGNFIESLAGGLTGLGAAATATKGVAGAAVRKAPARYVAEEAAASAGGALAKSAGQRNDASEGELMALELAGNILFGGVASRINTARDIRQRYGSFVAEQNERKRIKAADVLQVAARHGGEEPATVAKRIREHAGQEGERFMSPGVLSENAGTISLEKRVLLADPELATHYKTKRIAFTDYVKDTIRKTLGGESTPDSFVDFYRQRAEYITNLAERDLQNALGRARTMISELPPTGENYISEVRRIVEDSEAAARLAEKDAWAQIGRADTTVANTKTTLDELMAESTLSDIKGGMTNFPSPGVRGAIEDYAKPPEVTPSPLILPRSVQAQASDLASDNRVDVKELIGLRSNVLTELRAAQAEGNTNLARRLTELNEAILQDLNQADAEFPTAYNNAREISRDLNDRFTRDIIGKLMGKTSRGGSRIPDNETMQYLFQRGEKGRTNFRALKLANYMPVAGIQGDKVPAEAQGYVLQQFTQQAIKGGRVDTAAAAKFRQAYGPLLEESEQTGVIDNFIAAGQAADAAEEGLAKAVTETTKSAAGKLIAQYTSAGADLAGQEGGELVRALKGRYFAKAENPASIAKELFSIAKTDPTGLAREGLKTGYAQAFIESILTATGEQFSSKVGTTVKNLSNALHKTGEYTADEMNRINHIADFALKQIKAENQTLLPRQSATAELLSQKSILQQLLGYYGARLGAKMAKGGAALRVAGKVSSLGEKIGAAIGDDDPAEIIGLAVRDPALFADLLDSTETLSKAGARRIRRALRNLSKFAVTGNVKASQAQIFAEPSDEK